MPGARYTVKNAVEGRWENFRLLEPAQNKRENFATKFRRKFRRFFFDPPRGSERTSLGRISPPPPPGTQGRNLPRFSNSDR